MKIDWNNPRQILSHFLLSDEETVDKVVDTPFFKESGEVVAEVSFNGVTMPAQAFEDVLKKLFDRVEDHFREKYDAEEFDKRVEEKALLILKEHSDKAIEKIQGLLRVLEEPESFITPYWERKNDY